MSDCILITPHGSDVAYVRECWRLRRAMWLFARRDLVVRYRHTVIGLAWVLVKPLAAALIFSVIFGRIASLPSFGVPYVVLALSGLLLWQYCAAVWQESAICLANNPSLVTKVWLPRALLPTSSTVLNLVDMGATAVVLAALMAWQGLVPGWRIALAPLVLVPLMALTLGGGLLLAALAVTYRDLRNVVPVALQFGLLASPIAFSVHAAAPDLATWLWWNPLAGLVEWWRWSILPSYPAPPWWAVGWSVSASALVLALGYFGFRRWESRLADAL